MKGNNDPPNYDTSALSGLNVDTVFEDVANTLLKKVTVGMDMGERPTIPKG